jgi:hypothetical protein
VTVRDYLFSCPFDAMTWQALHNVVAPRHVGDAVIRIRGSHDFRPEQDQIDYLLCPQTGLVSKQIAVAKYDTTTLAASAH